MPEGSVSTGVDAVCTHLGYDAMAIEFRQHAIEHSDVRAIGACALLAFPTGTHDRWLMSSLRKARAIIHEVPIVLLDRGTLTPPIGRMKRPATPHGSVSCRYLLAARVRRYYESFGRVRQRGVIFGWS
jgi:hypothetical protein